MKRALHHLSSTAWSWKSPTFCSGISHVLGGADPPTLAGLFLALSEGVASSDLPRGTPICGYSRKSTWHHASAGDKCVAYAFDDLETCVFYEKELMPLLEAIGRIDAPVESSVAGHVVFYDDEKECLRIAPDVEYAQGRYYEPDSSEPISVANMVRAMCVLSSYLAYACASAHTEASLFVRLLLCVRICSVYVCSCVCACTHFLVAELCQRSIRKCIFFSLLCVFACAIVMACGRSGACLYPCIAAVLAAMAHAQQTWHQHLAGKSAVHWMSTYTSVSMTQPSRHVHGRENACICMHMHTTAHAYTLKWLS
jgi:hypothetical protein